jgi:molybdopterin synthase sulfur carrier subunit
MSVKVRFFARFRELLGTDIIVDKGPDTGMADLVREIARRNEEGYKAVFDEQGRFHEFVIVMRNGKRVLISDVEKIILSDGDEIAIFPPVAGG